MSCLCVQPPPPAFSRASPTSLPGTVALLHVNHIPLFLTGKELREDNKDYQQVLLDVRRSLRRFPPGEGRFSSVLSGGEVCAMGLPQLRPHWGGLQEVTLQEPDSRKPELTAPSPCSKATLSSQVPSAGSGVTLPAPHTVHGAVVGPSPAGSGVRFALMECLRSSLFAVVYFRSCSGPGRGKAALSAVGSISSVKQPPNRVHAPALGGP